MNDLTNLKAQLPSPSQKRLALRITPAAERALRKGHPWIYESAILSQSASGQSGDLAVIFDKKRRFLGIGLYDPDSKIRVRLLRVLKPALIGENFFEKKLLTAKKRRAPLLSPQTNGYRLLHGENDGMPGLVIDCYAQTAVIKLYTLAWIPHLREVLAALGKIISPDRVVFRLSDKLKKNPSRLENGTILYGKMPQSPLIFSENGLLFEVDPFFGQKTGFFLDQRENRARVENLAKGKRVLNAFSYTGGFSVYAARGGAKSTVSLDASKTAIAAAERNFALNFANHDIHKGIVGDAFKIMAAMKNEKRLFEMVIIDPPSFAHKKSQRDGAVRAYQQLTRLGVSLLAPNGILVQASCSSRVNTELFFKSIRFAARQAGRPLKEIERSGHALDHPIGFSEGEYLKCLFAVAA